MNLEKLIEKKSVEYTDKELLDFISSSKVQLKDYIDTYNKCIGLEDKKAFEIIEETFRKYGKVFFYSNTREFKNRLLEEIGVLNCDIDIDTKVLDYKKQNEEPKNN